MNPVESLACGLVAGLCLGVAIGAFFAGLFKSTEKRLTWEEFI
jgi:hypothetical protein